VLIAHHEIDHLELLQVIFQELAIPPAVAREVIPALAELPDWITESQPSSIHPAARTLDAGERKAISLAIEISGTLVLLDDLPARRRAEALRLPVIGSVGILLIAEEHGYIELVRPYMDSMRATRLFLGDRVYDGILRAAGEV
jgi:predicted nucleic acid-binding protein